MALAARGPAVVELLLEAVLGDVYDPDGPAPERAAETIDELPPGEASLGLTEVLCGRGHDELKGAAVDGLVALGGLAEPDLVAILDDPQGGDWARAALEQIRFEREHPDAGASKTRTTWMPATKLSTPAMRSPRRADASSPRDGRERARDDADEASGSDTAASASIGAGLRPVGDLVDDAYQDFLRRFEQDSGDESPSP